MQIYHGPRSLRKRLRQSKGQPMDLYPCPFPTASLKSVWLCARLQELSNMVWALAMLKQRPDGMWMARLDRESEDRMPDYQAQNLSNTVHALALFRWVGAFVRASCWFC